MPRPEYAPCFALWLAMAAPSFAGEEPLSLLYFERPPFYLTDAQGQASGSLVARTRAAARRAGLELAFESVPPGRILAELRGNTRAFCTPGWFYTPERGAYARFSAPLIRDLPFLILLRKELAERRQWSLQTLMDAPQLKLGVVAGFSYGTALDERIANRRGLVDRFISVEKALRLEQNLEKLRQGRIDFVFVNREEWLGRHQALEQDDLVHLAPSDMPPGEFRYLQCSYKVSPSRVARLSAALEQEQPELARQEREAGSLRLAAEAAKP
ncbi:MAG: transporter substrate-binding domain-containing protein [Gammaproteobacteria bacterium]|nr:transporter substrate-binding domain-containing protein [Gammaproteobacteria bacterium]